LRLCQSPPDRVRRRASEQVKGWGDGEGYKKSLGIRHFRTFPPLEKAELVPFLARRTSLGMEKEIKRFSECPSGSVIGGVEEDKTKVLVKLSQSGSVLWG
jgi:hypothetical protein